MSPVSRRFIPRGQVSESIFAASVLPLTALSKQETEGALLFGHLPLGWVVRWGPPESITLFYLDHS